MMGLVLKLGEHKGQAQVHWIFVVVAGSIILLFFVGFGFEYKDLQNSKLNSKVAMQFDNVINGLKIGEQYKVLEISEKVNVNFKCDSLTINNDFSHKWDENIIFSPDKISSDKFIIWAKKVEMPFGVDNIILISSKDYKIFILDSEYARGIVESIPRQFDNIKLIQISDLENINFNEYKNVKIISLGGYDLNSYRDKADVVNINGRDFGDLIFNDVDFSFTNKEMVYGAIFASSSSYSCATQKLHKKASAIANIYYNKALYLQDCCSNAFCNYNNIASELRTFSELFKQQNLNINSINLLSQSIILKNNDLFDKDCRVVF